MGGPARSMVVRGVGPRSPGPTAVAEQRRRRTIGFDSLQRRTNVSHRAGSGGICARSCAAGPAGGWRARAAEAGSPALRSAAHAVPEPDLRRPGTWTSGLRLAMARATCRGARAALRATACAEHGRCTGGCTAQRVDPPLGDRVACRRYVRPHAHAGSCVAPAPGCRGNGAEGQGDGTSQTGTQGRAKVRHRGRRSCECAFTIQGRPCDGNRIERCPGSGCFGAA